MKQKEPTAFEKAESERFNCIRKGLLSDGFEELEVAVTTSKLNLMGLVISIPIAAIIYLFYFMVHGGFTWFSKFSLTSLIFLIAFVLGVIIHELIHGLTWSIFCKSKWKSIRFKFIWDYLMPCCICSECISQFGYVAGLCMPIVVLGFISCIISFVTANHYLMLFSLAMIICAGGDLYLTWKIRKLKKWILIDHPVTLNCIAFKKK